MPAETVLCTYILKSIGVEPCKESYLDLVLFGTGTSFKLVPKELQSILVSRNIKYESMISSAAYNTYNILLSEARNFISVIKLI